MTAARAGAGAANGEVHAQGNAQMAGISQTNVDLTGPAGPANGAVNGQGNGGVDRAEPIETYEKELNTARWWAFEIGSLHACSRFLTVCNLTCATVILLGAFAPYLLPIDYIFVVCLLVLEGLRRALAYLSQHPKSINHSKLDDHYPRAEWARLSSQLLQLVFICPGVIIASIRLISKPNDDYNSIGARNVQKSLRIFYGCIFVNALVALVNLVCSAIATRVVLRKNYPTEQSFLRYFDKVLENAMGFGVVEADNFEFFRFAYTMLASEFRRDVQPEAVAKNHKKLIQYMYAHRLGVDFVQIYLNAEDAFVQLAAVNMVGFWADKVWGVPKLRLPEDLLTKLADKVGTGQVGWAATTSFGAVAASSPQGAEAVERTRTSRGLRLPDRLANLVDDSSSSRGLDLADREDDSSSRSYSLVRMLVVFYEQLCKGKEEAPMPFSHAGYTNLVAKLGELAEKADLHRLRVQAAYLLRLMNVQRACDPQVIGKIDPTPDRDDWLDSEVSMLQLLRKAIKLEEFVFEREVEHKHIAPPPWAQATNSPPTA